MTQERPEFARRQNALAFGLLSIVGVSDAPGRPLLWMVDAEGLALAKEEHDIQISGELQKLTELYLRCSSATGHEAME